MADAVNNKPAGLNDASTTVAVTNATDPKNIQDLTVFVQTLLQQMQERFQGMSDQIIARIDDMGTRIDDLEKNISELMTQVCRDGQLEEGLGKVKYSEFPFDFNGILL